MKNLLVKFLKYLTKDEEQAAIFQSELQQEVEQESKPEIEAKEKQSIIEKSKNQNKKKAKEQTEVRRKKPRDGDIVTIDARDIRDVMEVMEVPFIALSKNRTAPINYESSDGRIKVNISCHTNQYLASIYDWDIVLVVASKMQEIINSKSDIPPRTIIIPRHELLKALYKHDGKKEEKDLMASLARLKLIRK